MSRHVRARPAPAAALGLMLGLVLPATVAQAFPHGDCFMAEGAALGAAPGHDDAARLTLRFEQHDGHSFAVVALWPGDGPRAQADGVAGQVYDNAFFCGDGAVRHCEGDDDSGRFDFDTAEGDGLRLRSDNLGLIRVTEDGDDFTHIDLSDWTDPPDGWIRLSRADPAACEDA